MVRCVALPTEDLREIKLTSYNREKELMQQIANSTAQLENLDFQNKDYQQIVQELSQRISQLESDLKDCRMINQQLQTKLERLTEV